MDISNHWAGGLTDTQLIEIERQRGPACYRNIQKLVTTTYILHIQQLQILHGVINRGEWELFDCLQESALMAAGDGPLWGCALWRFSSEDVSVEMSLWRWTSLWRWSSLRMSLWRSSSLMMSLWRLSSLMLCEDSPLWWCLCGDGTLWCLFYIFEDISMEMVLSEDVFVEMVLSEQVYERSLWRWSSGSLYGDGSLWGSLQIWSYAELYRDGPLQEVSVEMVVSDSYWGQLSLRKVCGVIFQLLYTIHVSIHK